MSGPPESEPILAVARVQAGTVLLASSTGVEKCLLLRAEGPLGGGGPLTPYTLAVPERSVLDLLNVLVGNAETAFPHLFAPTTPPSPKG